MIWTALGVAGMWIGWRNLSDSRKDIEALAHANGEKNLQTFPIMRVIAYGHYRNDLFRFSKHVTITAIGVIAMTIPQVPNADPVTPTGLVLTIGIFTIVMLILLASTLDRRQRDSITDMEAQRKAMQGSMFFEEDKKG